MDERYRHETTHNGYSIFLDFFFLFICLHHQVWKRKMRRPSSIGKEKEPKFFFRRLCWPHRIQVIKNFRTRRLPFESAVHKTRTVATTAIKASGTGQKCFTCSTQHFLMSSYLFIPPAAWYLTLPLLFLYDSIELFVWGAVSCHKAAIILSQQQHTHAGPHEMNPSRNGHNFLAARARWPCTFLRRFPPRCCARLFSLSTSPFTTRGRRYTCRA